MCIRDRLWFDEASAALAGKTIHQATLSLRRSNGGSSAARNVYLGTVALRQADWATTYRPAFTAPSALPAYPAGQLSRECEGVYDITSPVSYTHLAACCASMLATARGCPA